MSTSFEGGFFRRGGLLGVQGLAILLAACSGSANMLPAENMQSTSFQSYDAVETAFDKVTPGQTDTRELSQLGFDAATAPNIERLSYLSIMARFTGQGALQFDNLPPGVKSCINAQERCSALVFHTVRLHAQRTGGVVTDLLGFERNTIATGWTAEVVFLMEDGTVVYKVLQGKPSTREVHDVVSPLGPLQNLGNIVVKVGKNAAKF